MALANWMVVEGRQVPMLDNFDLDYHTDLAIVFVQKRNILHRTYLYSQLYYQKNFE